MASAASQAPTRLTAGLTTDAPWQPLAQYGLRNPFFYHEVEDDFDSSIASSIWTQTHTGNGSIAHAAGDGGTILFTTNSAAPATTDIAAIQLPAAGFTIAAPKKLFFLARLQVSDVANAAFLAGLIQTTTTPFTVTDGIYFYKASGSASNLVLNYAVGGTITSLTIPVAAYTLANNTYVDLAFTTDRLGNLYAYIGSQLVGFIPQSGSGTLTPPRGPAASVATPTLTTATLNPTLAIQSGTASSKTMTADFIMASKER